MIAPALIAGGLLLGLLVGRWWALAAAVAVGLWIGLIEEVEISGALYGFLAGGVAFLAIAVGVFVRTRLRGQPSRPGRRARL
jgi:hypothetical protein